MGFQQGLSGLNAASKSLDVIGNNISNANTVGFKQGKAEFSDVYANALNGSSGVTAGIGTQLSAVVQQFTQGNITTTNNPLDVAINGGGFFRMSSNGAVSYTRNGQFQLDKLGNIVNSQGLQLTGYMANSAGVLQTGSPTVININTADIAPQATTSIATVLNLNSTKSVPANTPFSPTDVTTYNDSTSVNVYDSLGNPHVFQTFYVKDATLNTWNVFGTLDGTLIAGTGAPVANSLAQLTFSNLGALTNVTPSLTALGYPKAVSVSAPVATGAVTPLQFRFDFSNSTQFGSAFSVSKNLQDGYASGKLAKFNISKDGTLVGSYTNGKTNTLAQVVLASFTNPNGLQSTGDNQWIETASSGNPLVGPPNSGNLGSLTSSATEDSNTDLTGELVNMITAQRIYQANAQTVKTQDQILQTLVNLR